MQIADKELPKSRRQQKIEKDAFEQSRATSASIDNALKRKRDVPEQDPKLAEFLQAYEAPSKTNIWTNADAQVGGPVAAVDDAVPEIAVPEDESDGEYQLITKKPKVAQESVQRPVAPLEASANLAMKVESADKIVQAETMDGANMDATTETGPVSDADWLRSRTDRVLDFIEDDDVPIANTTTLSAKPDPIAEPAEDISDQKVEPPQVEVEQSVDAVPTEEDKIRETGRLYIRNLHFDVTEDDLREHFGQHGALEEVSTKTACIIFFLL